MCSGDRSSSANGAIALRQSEARSWSTSSSSVLSDWTMRGPSFMSVGCSREATAFWRARYAATLAREEQRSEQ